MILSSQLIQTHNYETNYHFTGFNHFDFMQKETVVTTKPEVVCGNLWTIYDTKPTEIEFIDCKTGEGQKIVEATYKARSQDLDLIESVLIKKYGMESCFFVVDTNPKMEYSEI
jgi:hypothetical protein